MADYTLQDAMELVLDAPDIDGVVIDPWGHWATTRRSRETKK